MTWACRIAQGKKGLTQRRNVKAHVMGDMAMGATKSDAGVQGLPCVGVIKQGKPCTPGVI